MALGMAKVECDVPMIRTAPLVSISDSYSLAEIATDLPVVVRIGLSTPGRMDCSDARRLDVLV